MARRPARRGMRTSPTAATAYNRHAVLHPVGLSLLRAEVRRAVRDAQIEAYARSETTHCTDFLAQAAWVIGMGAEVALHVHGTDAAVTRTLHGMLRTLLTLCRQGYCWRTRYAQPLNDALGQAHALLMQHDRMAWQFQPGADFLSHRIRTRAVDGSEVAGAEIYHATATATTT